MAISDREKDVLAFIAVAVRSVGALELLLQLRRTPERTWERDALVRELRTSPMVVEKGIGSLETFGLVARSDGCVRYSPASRQLDLLAAEAEALYRTKPVAVLDAIARAPSESMRAFAEAFRIKG